MPYNLVTNASKLLRQKYLCHATDVKEEAVKIEDAPMLCEFPNVFPQELLKSHPQREIWL